MIVSGLVSVTFRSMTPEKICDLCVRAGLKSIEWGGDIHVPAGDMAAAARVREMCDRAGLEICAYGSYFRVGDGAAEFEKNLLTAQALGAPLLRVWCGRMGAMQADEEYRRRIVGELREICALADKKGMLVAPEFHGGTLTDDPDSVRRLVAETADVENLRFYWQPRWDWDEATRLETLRMVLPRLAYIHTFTWRHTPDIERLKLSEGDKMWKKALKIAGETHALIEFVRNDGEEALLEDARALNGWIEDAARE